MSDLMKLLSKLDPAVQCFINSVSDEQFQVSKSARSSCIIRTCSARALLNWWGLSGTLNKKGHSFPLVLFYSARAAALTLKLAFVFISRWHKQLRDAIMILRSLRHVHWRTCVELVWVAREVGRSGTLCWPKEKGKCKEQGAGQGKGSYRYRFRFRFRQMWLEHNGIW